MHTKKKEKKKKEKEKEKKKKEKEKEKMGILFNLDPSLPPIMNRNRSSQNSSA